MSWNTSNCGLSRLGFFLCIKRLHSVRKGICVISGNCKELCEYWLIYITYDFDFSYRWEEKLCKPQIGVELFIGLKLVSSVLPWRAKSWFGLRFIQPTVAPPIWELMKPLSPLVVPAPIDMGDWHVSWVLLCSMSISLCLRPSTVRQPRLSFYNTCSLISASQWQTCSCCAKK